MAEAQAYQPRLKTHYNSVVRDALKEKFNLANTMQVPALEKQRRIPKKSIRRLKICRP